MNKRLLGSLVLLCLLFLAACQQQATPEERLKEYIGQWNEGKFAEMYADYLNEGSKSTYSKEDFVDRQEKLQEDLGIKNLKVGYTKPPEDAEWDPEKPADFRIQVKSLTATTAKLQQTAVALISALFLKQSKTNR
jgi:hypothetical protein